MDKTFDCLCIGLIVADLLVRPVNSNIFLIDTTIADEIKLMPGGDAINEAIIMARLGAKVGLAGKVGRDPFGQIALKEAADNMVNVKNVKIDATTKTAVSIVFINETGERNFVFCPGNNDVFTVNDIDLSLIKQTKIVNIGSIFGMPLLDRGGIETIFKIAHEYNVITTADVTHDVTKLGFEGIKNILKITDIFMPSFIEAAYLTKETKPEKMAEAFLRSGVKTVVIKLGNKGCYIKSAGETHTIATYPTKVVDTTGAGDNFVAGFLTGVLKGWDLEQCGMFANAAGALCVQNMGATTSVRSFDQVFDYMKKQEF
jgi:sugar/nucleoside kinase (ribokinase family)